MTDDTAYRRPPSAPAEKRYPPRAPQPGPPPGEDYFTILRLYGRPRGRFEEHDPPARPQKGQEP